MTDTVSHTLQAQLRHDAFFMVQLASSLRLRADHHPAEANTNRFVAGWLDEIAQRLAEFTREHEGDI